MHSVVSYGSTAMAFGRFGDTAMSPFNLFWGFFCVWQIHKASTQRSFTFSYPKINQNWFVLSSGASSQVACTGGSRMECGILQLGSTACPKNVLSPPERLCRRRGFEVGATVGARCWHVGWQLHSQNLQQAGVLFILVHVDATQALAPTRGGD